MIRARSLLILVAAISAVALPACQSSQDKAAELRERAELDVASQQGVQVKQVNKEVKVVGTTVLSDQYGAAVVVGLKNESKEAQVNLPILIDVLDAKGKSVFTNDIPGLDPSLTHVPLLLPGETSYWVHDQVQPSGDPKSVKVKVGPSSGRAPDQIPELAVSTPKIHKDSSGIEAEGEVTNKSQVDQQELVLFAVARRGSEVVAAGRANFKNLAAGRPLPYNIFFIGDPTGADVEVTAPPLVLQ